MIAEIIVVLALWIIIDCLKGLIGTRMNGARIISILQVVTIVVAVITILSAVLRGFA